MRNLKFNRLLILSNSEKSANVFQFPDRINLITATENSVGKSTILKVILWTFGCETALDGSWKNLDCRSVVEFSINNEVFKVSRYHDTMALVWPDGTLKQYEKITGEFARDFAEIVNFRLLLPSRQDELETPPPAYYFLPFYIDQRKSWEKPWSGFERLEQYADWKRTLIGYHTGVLTPEYFQLEEERFRSEAKRKLLDEEISKISTAIEIFSGYAPKISKAITLDEKQFEIMTEEVRTVLSKLAMDQESLLAGLTLAEAEKSNLRHQLQIAKAVVDALEEDYKFSVENIKGDLIECPLCGTEHKNTAVERAGVLADKQKANNQLEGIIKASASIDSRLDKLRSRIGAVKSQITQINARYVDVDKVGGPKQSLPDLVETMAGRSLESKAKYDQQIKLGEKQNTEDALKRIRREKQELRTQEREEDVNFNFSAKFLEFARLLKTDEANLAAVRKPTDYGKVANEGGAAEGVRLLLAYDLAIFAVSEQYGTSIKSPLLIDTPNQQEQSDPNYDGILHLIINGASTEAQIFLSAMTNPHLEAFFENANVIVLNQGRLLRSDKFEEVKGEISQLFSQID